MVTVIIVGIVILSLVLLGWTWVSLGNIEKQKKIFFYDFNPIFFSY